MSRWASAKDVFLSLLLKLTGFAYWDLGRHLISVALLNYILATCANK